MHRWRTVFLASQLGVPGVYLRSLEKQPGSLSHHHTRIRPVKGIKNPLPILPLFSQEQGVCPTAHSANNVVWLETLQSRDRLFPWVPVFIIHTAHGEMLRALWDS